MKKLFLPISAFLVFVLSLQAHEAMATTNFTLKDQASCKAAPTSGTWDAASSTCTVTSLTIASTNKLTISNGITLVINGDTIINSGGQIVVNGILVNNGDFTNSGTLTNSGGIITNAGTITNSGTINNKAQGTFTNNSGGTITNNSGGTISNTSNSTINNSGTITNNSGGTISNSASLIINPGAILTNSGTFTNSGTIIVYGHTVYSLGGVFGNSGTISNTGSITILCTASFGGSGTITGNPVTFGQCPGEPRYRPPSIGNDYYNQYGGGITINGKPFDINNYSTKIAAQVLKIGQPANVGLKIYGERGAYTISHLGMYFHFKGDPSVINADTWISWDKAKGLDLHDPDKIFSKASVDTKMEGSYFYVAFTLVPQKAMPDSSLILRMWDDKLASGDVPIWGAIVIVDPNAPVPVKKIPTDQYGDYVTLEQILDKDGYYIPTLLNKFHGMPEIYKSVDINWVYDRGVDKLTMIESDRSGNLIGSIVCDLFKKALQPTVTDHDYFHFTTQQYYRTDPAREEVIMNQEAQKAEKILESMQVLQVDSKPKITLSTTANSILDAFRVAESSQLYISDPIKEQEAKKLEEYKADKILQSMGVKLKAYGKK